MYQPLPTEVPYSASKHNTSYESDEEKEGTSSLDLEGEAPRRALRRQPPLLPYDLDPRFRIKTPSPFARGGLLVLIVFLFWLAVGMRRDIWVAGGMGMSKHEPEEVDPSY